MGHLNSQNFHQAYILAGRVKRKLVLDANNPRLGLRMLVLQANMLDNLMGDIDDYSHVRYLENKAAALKLQKERMAQSKVSQVALHTKPDPTQQPLIHFQEVELELSDDEDFVDDLSDELELDYLGDDDYYDTPDELAQLVTAVTQLGIRRENHSFIEEEELSFEENYFAPAITA